MKEKAGGGFGHEAINSEFAAENILGGAHAAFHVRLDLNKTSCRVQQQRSGREAASESRLRPTITNDIILFCFAQRANLLQTPHPTPAPVAADTRSCSNYNRDSEVNIRCRLTIRSSACSFSTSAHM